MIHSFKFWLFPVNLRENVLRSWHISTVMQRPFRFPMIPACYHTRTHTPLQPFQAWLPIMWACLRGPVHRPRGVDRPRLLLTRSLLPPDNSHRLGVMSAWHLVTERGRDSEERSELQERPSHDAPTLTFAVPVILLNWKHRGEKLEVEPLWHLSFSTNPCLRALTVVKFEEINDKLLCLPNRMKSHLLFCVPSQSSALGFRSASPVKAIPDSMDGWKSGKAGVMATILQKHAKSTQMMHKSFSQESTLINGFTSYLHKQAAPSTHLQTGSY